MQPDPRKQRVLIIRLARRFGKQCPENTTNDVPPFGRTAELQMPHHFLQALQEKRRPLVDGYDGRRTVELIEAIYRSTESGEPVKLPLK